MPVLIETTPVEVFFWISASTPRAPTEVVLVPMSAPTSTVMSPVLLPVVTARTPSPVSEARVAPEPVLTAMPPRPLVVA